MCVVCVIAAVRQRQQANQYFTENEVMDMFIQVLAFLTLLASCMCSLHAGGVLRSHFTVLWHGPHVD